MVSLPRRIKRHIGLSLCLVIITTSAAAGISRFVLRKSYTSSATLLVIPGRNANGLTSALQLTPTFADMATSNTVWNRAAQSLPDSISPIALQAHTTVNAVNNTDLIIIKTTAPSPSLAALEATQVAEATINAAQQLTGSAQLQLSSPAATPTHPSFPDTKKIDVLACLLSLMGAVFLAVLRDHVNQSLQTEEEVNEWLDLPVWGMIPRLRSRAIPDNSTILHSGFIDKKEDTSNANRVALQKARHHST